MPGLETAIESWEGLMFHKPSFSFDKWQVMLKYSHYCKLLPIQATDTGKNMNFPCLIQLYNENSTFWDLLFMRKTDHGIGSQQTHCKTNHPLNAASKFIDLARNIGNKKQKTHTHTLSLSCWHLCKAAVKRSKESFNHGTEHSSWKKCMFKFKLHDKNFTTVSYQC